MTAASLVLAILFCLFGVLLPGSGAGIFLSTRGWLRLKSDPISLLLVYFSFGIGINAFVFMTCWTLVPAGHALAACLTMLGITAAIAAAVLWKNRHSRGPMSGLLFFMLALGSAVGIFAAVNFPNSLDSFQVLQVQQYILGSIGGQDIAGNSFERVVAFFFGGMPIPAQSGFAGILFVPSLLQLGLPVTTVSAANKVILLALAAVVSLYVARQIKSPSPIISALLIFVILIVSQFGLSGLFLTGKDSVFSVIMSIACIAALASNDDEANEPGIFMSAGILLGAVSVPYLLVFWAIFFATAPRANLQKCLRQAWWCLVPLIITVVSVREAFSTPDAFKVNLALPLMAGVILLGALTFSFRRLTPRPVGPVALSSRATAFIPLVAVIAIASILPVDGGSMHGDPVPAPLDGKTSAIDFAFSMYRNNAGITLLCLLAMCFGPLLTNRLRTPWAIALLGFLPVTSLFAFAHVRFNWHLLPMFNLWDISRDTVQWYGGAAGGIIALVAVTAIFATSRRWVALLPVAVFFFLAVPWNVVHFVGPWTTKPTVTTSGGSYEPISARAFDLIWREGRGLPLYVDTHPAAFNGQYYSFQMFGPSSVDRFSAEKVGTDKRQILLVGVRNLPPVLTIAAGKKSSGWVRKLGNDEFAVSLVNDGRSQMDLGGLQQFSVEYVGAYDQEQSDGVPFRWMKQQSKIRVYRFFGDGDHCVRLKFVNAWANSRQQVKLRFGVADHSFELPEGASFREPHVERVCLQFGTDGSAEIDLTVSEPGRSFPGDDRSIAFALLQSLV